MKLLTALIPITLAAALFAGTATARVDTLESEMEANRQARAAEAAAAVAEYSRGADTCTELPPLPYLIDAAERALIEGVVMAEAGNQPPEGMMAVAQCIVDAARKDGIRPDEVISRYQYAAVHPAPSDAVREAVSRVFDDGERVTAEDIYFFYNPAYGRSEFHESRTFVAEIAEHRFYQ